MSESDIMFNERDRRCAAVQHMLSTDSSYDNRTIASILKMQIWIATNNRDMSRVMKTKFPAMVMVFGVLSSQGQIMPPHIFEVCLKVTTKVYVDVLKSVVIPWCNQLGVASGLGAGPQVQRDSDLASEGVLRLCTLLSLAPSSPDLSLLDYFAWSYVDNITNMTSHNTKASLIAAIRRVFAELSPVLVEKECSQFRILIEAVIEAEGGYIEQMSALQHHQVI